MEEQLGLRDRGQFGAAVVKCHRALGEPVTVEAIAVSLDPRYHGASVGIRASVVVAVVVASVIGPRRVSAFGF